MSTTSDGGAQHAHVAFEALGTSWSISLNPQASLGARPPAAQHDAPEWFSVAVASARAWLADYDAVFSRFRTDSVIYRLAQTGGVFEVPRYAADMMRLYVELERATGGDVSVFVADKLAAAGYGPAAPSTQHIPPADSPWKLESLWDDSTLRLTIPQGGLLDVGAAGKGLAVDIVAGIVVRARDKARESGEILVDGSGDLVTTAPIRIGLEDPRDTSRVVGAVDVGATGFASSSPARRRRGSWHHIISAITGEPATSLQAVWVKAPTCCVADGLATALFFTAPEALASIGSFEWLVMLDDALYRSEGFGPVVDPRTNPPQSIHR